MKSSFNAEYHSSGFFA